MQAPSPRVPRPIASLCALLVLLGGGTYVASFSLPMDRYLTGLGPRLLSVWLLLATFLVAALSFGHFLVRRVSAVPRDGAWALAFSSGTMVFSSLMGLFGWLGWLAFPFFWVLPLSLGLIGLPSLRDAVVDSRQQRTSAPAYSWVELALLLLGGVCLALLLLQVINPSNVNYDAAWYHLRSAERYALANAISRTPEGDMLLTLPSCASWLYTWAFLAPGLGTDDKIVLALHLEGAVFIGTLASIPPLVRALLPQASRFASRVSWVALFFFPSVFIYDTGLMGGADHIVALWAGTTVLAWVQARARGERGSWALVGLQLAGLSAKYSSLYLIVPLLPVMVVDTLRRGARPWRSLLTAAGVTLLVTAPYWLRNWVWYHNPVYPAASGLFPSTPWTEDAQAWQAYWSWSDPSRAEVMSPEFRLWSSFKALVDYQQKVYGWSDMMGGQSVMGSGYFLSLLVLPFLPQRRRLFGLAVLLNVGIFLWFNTHLHHLRYLTVLTPLMAAGMAASAIALWGMGLAARTGVAGCTALLLAAYADIPFRHTHRMNRGSSTVDNADHFISQRGPGNGRMATFRAVSDALPPMAKPLVHGSIPPLGLQRQSVTDVPGLQFGVNYGRWGSVAQVWRSLRSMGVTHLVWIDEAEQADSIAGEALFQALAMKTESQRVVDGIMLGELPDEAPAEPGTHIVYVGCNHLWRTGVYPLNVLARPIPPADFEWPELSPYEPLSNQNWSSATGDPRVGWVVQEASCGLRAPQGFVAHGGARGSPQTLRFFVRASPSRSQ
jgi:hypothetical protein